jgi:NADH-quinone oxidoreductase subunit L
MLVGMSPLLILAVIAGVFQTPFFGMVEEVLSAHEYHIHSHATVWIMLIGTQLFVGLAILYAFKKYGTWSSVPDGSSAMENSFIYKLLYNQYYIPYAYEEYIVKPYRELSELFWKELDVKVVDATVDGIASVIYNTGENTRDMQSGNLSTMLKWMVAGTVILLSLAVVVGLAARYIGV